MDKKAVNELLLNPDDFSDADLRMLIERREYEEMLMTQADKIRREYYGKDVYIRGLIEISNHCENDCFYCGLRHSNKNIERYRLTDDAIVDCCSKGYGLGIRTFVLQSGEDEAFDDLRVCSLIKKIKTLFSGCAVTLSLGEKSYETYKKFRAAGADRYLLRHETSDQAHFLKLHPKNQSAEKRKQCLFDLKSMGFQTGAGLMTGSPHQTTDHLIKDFRFMQDLKPDMIGIGPFLPHKDTPFAKFAGGDIFLVLRTVALSRLMFPKTLIPATTAAGASHPMGLELALRAGANVIMPNLSPHATRKLYALYDTRPNAAEETTEYLDKIRQRVSAAGYSVNMDVGHVCGA
ncbi:MAG: [FeFe] hydrogenase H-cluster radical SAM maturase HydE [Defluviitaleaceae bacterium]|nr:[FeFe] hydrogenase H-cluster radical SAM maturase HydE [Defluviitaleaceae bacterium]